MNITKTRTHWIVEVYSVKTGKAFQTIAETKEQALIEALDELEKQIKEEKAYLNKLAGL